MSTDLEKIIKNIQNKDNHYGQDKLSIWGGQCPADQLSAFLQDWSLAQMPYRIWEYVSEIEFSPQTTNQPPKNIDLLEYGRLFGDGGDLTIRRDGPEFRWHFIGGKDAPEPPATGNPKDFWETHSGLTFHKWKDEALLWGKYAGQDKHTRGDHRWHDDRVARATLEYPIPNGEAWERVMIEYWTFNRAGQMQFVWFRDLKEWEDAKDGNGQN